MSQKEGAMSQYSYGFPVNHSIYRILSILTLCILWLWRPVQADTPAVAAPTSVDQIQQLKSMGYTDSRKLVRDSTGNLYVAYRKKYKLHYETAYHIFVAKSRDNGRTWLILNHDRPIETVGDLNQRVPSIAIDRQDRLHVVWYGPDGASATEDENQIKYVQSTDGGVTWSAWRNLAPVAGYAGQERWQEHPTIFVSADQQLYVVWEGRDDWYHAAAQIKVVQSNDGGRSWTAWRNIAPTAYSRSRPSLVASGAYLYAFAYGSRGGIQQVLYATSLDGGNRWSSWRQVAASVQDQRHVSAAIDQTGIVHIVWRQPPFLAAQEQGQNSQVYYASFDGVAWSAPVRVGSHLGGAQTYPSIAVDGQRTVWITWLETTDPYDFPNDAPTSGALYYVAKNDQGWSQPILYGAGGNNLYPSLRRDLTMRTTDVEVVWLEAQPLGNVIRFAQLTRPTQFAPVVIPAEERRAMNSPFARIAWALELDSLPLKALQVNILQQPGHPLHELTAIFQLLALVSLYVIIKFAIKHRLWQMFA